MDRRNFLKRAALPVAASVLTVKAAEPKAIEAVVSKRISKLAVVLLDGDKPVSDPVPCRFEMGDNYGKSLDKVSVSGNREEKFRVTHIGLGEFKVPLDSGPVDIGPYDTFTLPSIHFSFGEKL